MWSVIEERYRAYPTRYGIELMCFDFSKGTTQSSSANSNAVGDSSYQNLTCNLVICQSTTSIVTAITP